MVRPHRLAGNPQPPPHLVMYAEVARLDLKLHRRMFGRRLCRSCRDPWPCARHLEVSAALGRQPGVRGWWLAGPALLGLTLIAAVMAGAVPW